MYSVLRTRRDIPSCRVCQSSAWVVTLIKRCRGFNKTFSSAQDLYSSFPDPGETVTKNSLAKRTSYTQNVMCPLHLADNWRRSNRCSSDAPRDVAYPHPGLWRAHGQLPLSRKKLSLLLPSSAHAPKMLASEGSTIVIRAAGVVYVEVTSASTLPG